MLDDEEIMEDLKALNKLVSLPGEVDILCFLLLPWSYQLPEVLWSIVITFLPDMETGNGWGTVREQGSQ